MVKMKRKVIYLSLILIFVGIAGYLLITNPDIQERLGLSPRPNVLLITVDALRPDHLGCYGYQRYTSPNIDKLARGGVLFTQAIAQGSWTWPSIHSLLTGTYPSTHKVYFWDSSLSDYITTLPRMLKDYGYNTAFITGHGGLSTESGLRGDFDTWEDISGAKADKTTQEAIDWMREYQRSPFFLWLHYMDTHDMYFFKPSDERRSVEVLSELEIKNGLLNYDKAISQVDAQIGRLLEELEKLGLYKNTIIIITADHGEEMGEHSLYFNHGGWLWESLIRVPLIIFYFPLFKEGQIIEQQAQHIDIVPTLVDILGVRQAGTFEGRNLLALIRGKEVQSVYAFSEHRENEGEVSDGQWVWTIYSVRGKENKLILILDKHGEHYKMFDLVKDPLESKDIKDKERSKFLF